MSCRSWRGLREIFGLPQVLEPLHLAFSSSGRLTRIVRPVVSPSTGTMPMLDSKITRGRVIRSQIVRDKSLRQEAIFLQEALYALWSFASKPHHRS